MVIDKQGYDDLIMYLTAHLAVFEQAGHTEAGAPKVMELIEDAIATNVMRICEQHPNLTTEQRSAIVREVDAIVYDLQEVLSRITDKPVTQEQREFIDEFVGLIKNLFDSAVV